MWIRTRKCRLVNLVNTFDLYANDPRSEVGGRTFAYWTVVARNGSNYALIATCDSQQDAEAMCARIWEALEQRVPMLDLSETPAAARAA